jgi:CubicO group peptidase (beta-lactamase class C family)
MPTSLDHLRRAGVTFQRTAAAVLTCIVLMPAHGWAQDPAVASAIDHIAARLIQPGGPGCTVGARRGGGAPVTRAFGLADVERNVPLNVESILEAGSVSKQFTAAAVALLAIDGKLSFDDDARKWFPELPDYGTKITVRHLLTHTSGLRDWGAVAAMEGWPRGERAHTNAHALEIAARQRALNYKPGSAYSYTNTGYNLLAILVERASGKSLAEFSRERLFVPLGMTHTSWRDDYKRIVPGRALAYAGGRAGFTIDMPNEDVYGNGGLLTTVGDLLTWNDAMHGAKLGRALADSVVKQFTLTNGRTISYALGLFIQRTRGYEVQHSGSTAGYRAHLIRFPDANVSVAVLCNAGNAANATSFANQLADSLLPPRIRGPVNIAPGDERIDVKPYAGNWVDDDRHTIVRLTAPDNALRSGNMVYSARSSSRFEGTQLTLVFSNFQGATPSRMMSFSAQADTVRYRRVGTWSPTVEDLRAFVGTYSTPEVAGAPFQVALEGNQLVMRQSPSTRVPLTVSYPDAFTGGGSVVWFSRDASKRVTALHLSEARVWDMVFAKQ